MMALNDYLLPCLNKKLMGIECFGCGFQRSILLVFHGDFYKAFQLFPAVYPLILFFATAGLNFLDTKRNYGPLMIGLAVLSVIFMVVSYIFKHPITL